MTEASAFDLLVDEFEQAWNTAKAPSIHNFLLQAETDDAEQKDRLLVELICIDMERRWNNVSECAVAIKSVEDYCAEFTRLDASGEMTIFVIEEEYRVRRQWGPAFDRESYFERFPAHKAVLFDALARVDEQLAAERPQVGGESKRARSVDRAVAQFEGAVEQASLCYSDYMLHEMIGSGQMGRVYRATHRPTDAAVAVKFLRKSFCREGDSVHRFLREARTVSQLRHDGIIRVFGVGATPGGGYFIVMEYLCGPDLSRLIADGPVSTSDAVRWTIQAADAIGHSNERDVVHCDLKPANLVLDDHRNVRVTDFGLARSMGDDSVTVDRIAGTAPFMAPEQACAGWGPIGHHTDVYGLGAVLYCLVTGRPPQEGRTIPEVLSCVVSGVLPIAPDELRPDVGADLAAVIVKAIAKNSNSRYASALDLSVALQSVNSQS
jgi:hypothetical protein